VESPPNTGYNLQSVGGPNPERLRHEVQTGPVRTRTKERMSSPSETPDSAIGGWTPELPITVPAPLMWPPRPTKVLRYLFGFPGLYFPWIAVYAAIALGLWEVLQVSGSDLSHLSAGWIALLFGCNAVIAASVYGTWHYQLYGRRAQGLKFKYSSHWPKERSDRFLFGRPTASNVFWTLGSGVPIWSAYVALTLWAQATGIAPVTSWSRSPIYCVSLMLILPFFHAVHFYVGHRAIHWSPLYNTVHYLHHANVNPSPWSGLAMHPVEHLLYFSGVLLLWVIPSTPIHALFYVTFVGLAPVEGHCGFGKVVLGRSSFDTDNFYHYLHHKFFRVNFGDPLLIPLDRLFGTFHDGIRKVPAAKHIR
jgi:sterol desaturase/sphingolipid hydroxylase (fatty acid hydroxylase superfamily)